MNKDTIYWAIEQYGPYLAGVLGAGIFVCLVLHGVSQNAIDKVLDIAVTLAAIFIGFIGALLGILFMIRDTSAIKLLFLSEGKTILKKHFKRNIIGGIL